MTNFTKEVRQQIVREFAVRHNGHYNPKLFLEEVEKAGKDHPAYDWFEWNNDRAALEHKLWQARKFAKGLKVSFKIEEVGRKKPLKVKVQEMPLVLSPMETRNQGGGYVLVNPDDPEHMKEHCRQAGTALRSWLSRYGSALTYAGQSVKKLEQLAALLEGAAENAEQVA